MDAQLRLLNTPSTHAAPGGADADLNAGRPPSPQPPWPTSAWRLSADTRKIGREGVAQARAALHSARRPADDARRSAA